MGNEQSAMEGGEQYGYRVLGIQEDSPSCTAGFVSFFDFILAANGIRLDTHDSTFLELIANNEDKPLQLSVFNVKSQTTREITLTPSNNWPGKGLLGVTIRFDSFEGAEDEVLHVLTITKNSPAELAGLQPHDDFILGTPERVFRDADEFYDEIMDNIDRSFQCYVYNISTDQVRIVTILPNSRWGGEGYLGGEIGYGFLHRLPEQSRNSTGTSVGYVSIAPNVVAATESFVKPKLKPQEETKAEATFQDISLDPTPESSPPPPLPVVVAPTAKAPEIPVPSPQEGAAPQVTALSFDDGTAVVTPGAKMASQATPAT